MKRSNPFVFRVFALGFFLCALSPSAARASEFLDWTRWLAQAGLIHPEAQARLSGTVQALAWEYQACRGLERYRTPLLWKGVFSGDAFFRVPPLAKEQIVSPFRDRRFIEADWRATLASKPGQWILWQPREPGGLPRWFFLREVIASRTFAAQYQEDLHYAACMQGQVEQDTRDQLMEEPPLNDRAALASPDFQRLQRMLSRPGTRPEELEALSLGLQMQEEGRLPRRAAMERLALARLSMKMGWYPQALGFLRAGVFPSSVLDKSTREGWLLGMINLMGTLQLGDWTLFSGYFFRESDWLVQASEEETLWLTRALERSGIDMARFLLGNLWVRDGGEWSVAEPAMVGKVLALSQDAELGAFRLLTAVSDARLDPRNRGLAWAALESFCRASGKDPRSRLLEQMRSVRLFDPDLQRRRDLFLREF